MFVGLYFDPGPQTAGSAPISPETRWKSTGDVPGELRPPVAPRKVGIWPDAAGFAFCKIASKITDNPQKIQGSSTKLLEKSSHILSKSEGSA